jgi:hypothetical protein
MIDPLNGDVLMSCELQFLVQKFHFILHNLFGEEAKPGPFTWEQAG